MDIKEKVTLSKAVILKMYLDETDTRDWAVAFSGGKDSTAVMALMVSVLESLPKEQRIRKVHAVMSDTVMENPLVHDHMKEQMDQINEYARKKDLPISVTQVVRPLEQSFYYLVLGKGYPLPQNNGKARWCTSRLKIDPQIKFLKKINPSYTLTGVRSAESTARARSIEKFQIDEFIGFNKQYKDTFTLMPIVHWTIQDVWRFLEVEGISWGSTLSVRTIYKDATGECGFSNPVGVETKSVEVCGARHGCWNCPVIMKDRSTEKMSEKHEWLEPLTEWRATMIKVYGNYQPDKPKDQPRKERSAALKDQKEKNEKIKLITKSGYQRNGKRLKDGQGCLTMEARKFLFDQLLTTEKLVNRLRKYSNLEPITLLSEEEKEIIQKQWFSDYKNAEYLITNPLGIEITELEMYL